MFENFQLAVIIKNERQLNLKRIMLHQDLQEEMNESWYTQYNDFLSDYETVEFDPNYNLDESEVFVIDDYQLPEILSNVSSLNITELDSLENDVNNFENIKGVCAFVTLDGNHEFILFQNFNRSHIIRPGRFLLLENNVYQSIPNPGLSLDTKLSAVYDSREGKLYFKSFRTTNTFLPLMEFYQEATSAEIRSILSHEKLHIDDPDIYASSSSQWFRKRFAMLERSGILDDYSVEEIVEHSIAYEIDIEVQNGKILFPTEKTEGKRLLQFLNEELYRGAITDKLYETNSKRESTHE